MAIRATGDSFFEHWKIGTIAAQLNVHPDTVRLAIESDAFYNRSGTRDRITLTQPNLGFHCDTLKEYPTLTSSRLFEMIRAPGYKGSVEQLWHVVRNLRPTTRQEAYLRLDTMPGEQAQADWASFGLVSIDQARRRLSCFAITLSYSRALHLEFFFDQRLENLTAGLVHAFAEWGGTPRTILFDYLASVVQQQIGRGGVIAEVSDPATSRMRG